MFSIAKPRQRKKLVNVRSVVWYVGFSVVESIACFIVVFHHREHTSAWSFQKDGFG